jgi:hypothetical protein
MAGMSIDTVVRRSGITDANERRDLETSLRALDTNRDGNLDTAEVADKSGGLRCDGAAQHWMYTELGPAENALLKAGLLTKARNAICENNKGPAPASVLRFAVAATSFVVSGREERTPKQAPTCPAQQPPVAIKAPPKRDNARPSVPAHSIVIAGPGGAAFNRGSISSLKKGLEHQTDPAHLTVVGNGEEAVALADIVPSLRRAKKEGAPITLLIEAHGEVKNGKHHIQLGENNLVPTKTLFNTLKKELGNDYPLAIFMTSCHGGAALANANSLPRGTSVAVLAPASETVAGQDVERFTESLSKHKLDNNGNRWMESHELLLQYLCRGLETRIPPSIANAGDKPLDLDANLSCRLGKPFSLSDRQVARTQLRPYLAPAAVDAVLKTIEGGQVDAKDYGAALAVMLVLNRDF